MLGIEDNEEENSNEKTSKMFASPHCKVTLESSWFQCLGSAFRGMEVYSAQELFFKSIELQQNIN